MGKQVCGLSVLTSDEKKLVTRLAFALLGVLSVHFVLVALWLVIVRRAQAPFFGQPEEVVGMKLLVWAALLSCCGVSGLLTLILKSVRAAKPALACWFLLLTVHAWYLVVGVFSRMWSRAEADGSSQFWSMTEIAVQLLADAMNALFLVWFVRHGGDNDSVKDQFLREPLLPVRSDVQDSLSN
ncbi:hypothetical protein PRNP1_009812 [Phytophthora ramorum]